MEKVSGFIEKRMKLKVNRSKSKVATSERVKFLGMTIVNGMVVIAKKSIARALEEVRTLTPRRTHIPIEKQIEAINLWYLGWCAYYQMTELPAQLRTIEARIRRRLRAQFVRNQKRSRNLYRKLRRMGVRAAVAAKAAFSSWGCWALDDMEKTVHDVDQEN